MTKKRELKNPNVPADLTNMSEPFFKAFQISPALMAISTIEDGKYVIVNEAFIKKTGYSSNEIVGHTSKELNIFVDYGDRDATVKKLRDEGSARNIRADIRTRSGAVLKGFFNADMISLDGRPHLLTMFNDMTETLDAMQALAESESRYAVLASLGNDYHFKLSVDDAGNARMDSISANYPDLTGRTIDDARSMEQWTSFIHPDDAMELQQRLDMLVRTGGKDEFECRSLGNDREPRWVQVFCSAASDPATGKVTEIWGVVKDITVRKSAELAMRKSEEKYRALAESSPEMIYVIDGNGTVQYVNSAALVMFGKGLKSVVGKHLRDLYPPALAERHLKAIGAVMSTGRSLNTEVHEQFPARSCWIDARLSPIRDATGAITGVLGMSQDITSRKRAEERAIAQRDLGIALLQTTELREGLRICFESALCVSGMDCGGIYLKDASGALNLFHHQDLSEAFVENARCFAADSRSAAMVMNGKPVYIRFEAVPVPAFPDREKEGLRCVAVIPFLHRNEVIGCLNIASHSLEEITDEAKVAIETIVAQIGSAVARLQAEDSLRESERRYRSIFEHSNDGFFLHDFKGFILDCNDNLCRMLGYSREEIVGAHLTKIDSPHEQQLMPQRMKSELETGILHFEGHHVRKDGSLLAVDISARVVSRDGNGVVQSFVRDISERKRAEETLRESEERFRTIFEQASAGIAMSDSKFRFFRVNAAFCAMLGYSAQELSGMTFRDITHPDHLENDAENVYKLTRGEIAVYKTQKRYIRKNGAELWAELSLSVMYDSAGRFLHYLVMVEDISARKRAEEELQRAEKIESLKVFAGGIAHDFNNLLGGIFGYFDLARHELPKDHLAYEYLDKSFSAFERAKHLARQMLTFAKGGAPIKKTVRLQDILRDSCSLALSGSSIKCDYRIHDSLWPVEGDEHQLAQVFSNLVINAWQAMPEGGTITISAENRELEAGQAGKLPAGRYVAVIVRDEGIGIPEKILDKIFDPFFTTKQRGSGLGLATCYSIVTRHGGHIGVASQPGAGSAFTIMLPASDREGVNEQEAAAGIDLRGSGRVLVMDDERVIREMIHDILTGFGYEVVMSADGKEAVEKFGHAIREKKTFDLVILDLTVPGGMGGSWTLRELKKIDPQVAAIVSSGYSDDTDLTLFREQGFSGMVPKPYRTNELLLAVKKAMGKEGVRGQETGDRK